MSLDSASKSPACAEEIRAVKSSSLELGEGALLVARKGYEDGALAWIMGATWASAGRTAFLTGNAGIAIGEIVPTEFESEVVEETVSFVFVSSA